MDKITSFRGEYRFLSNFYPVDIMYNGITYHSAEIAYQAQKYPDIEKRLEFAKLKNPVAAKRMGKKAEVDPDLWRTFSPLLMLSILQAKFSVPELAEKLLATGNAYLEESNTWHDNFWGNCTCEKCKDIKGENYLGRLLTLVRINLQTPD